jgi:hypothetical protein
MHRDLGEGHRLRRILCLQNLLQLYLGAVVGNDAG